MKHAHVLLCVLCAALLWSCDDATSPPDGDRDAAAESEEAEETEEAEPDPDVDPDNDPDIDDEECPPGDTCCVDSCVMGKILVECIPYLGSDGCWRYRFEETDCSPGICEDFPAHCVYPDGDVEDDNDNGDVECPELELGCVNQCDGNTLVECESYTDADGCPNQRFTNTDCSPGICDDSGEPQCVYPDGDMDDDDDDVECPPMDNCCADYCSDYEENILMHCVFDTDENGCPGYYFEAIDCSPGVCNNTIGMPQCVAPDGDEDTEPEEAPLSEDEAQL